MTQSVDPTAEQFSIFKSLPRNQPVQMLNLIRLKERASYKDGRIATGLEAYEAYGRESGPVFSKVGGTILWRGKPEAMVIGPSTDVWDIAFIASYPEANNFLAMVTDPTYQAVVFHRQAAVEDSRLIRMAPIEGPDLFG